MREYIRNHKKLHIWLLAETLVLAAFFALRGNRALVDGFTSYFADPVRRALRAASDTVPFSIAEVCCVLLVLAAAALLIFAAVRLIRGKKRGETLALLAERLLAIGLTVYAVFCLLWGVYYYTDRFYEQSGLDARGGTAQELAVLTRRFADGAARAAEQTQRTADGRFSADRDAILAQADTVYDCLYAEFPFLRQKDSPPKPIFFSRIMSYLDFTGFYCPFTGESNVNMDSPVTALPETVAHELAHRRGIASEQECSFLGILAAVKTDNADYNYSGWLAGYIYLSNALYAADYETWREIALSLPDTVRADLRYTSEYWAQFEGAVQKASDTVYDGFLKSYGSDIRSYGACVDLLLAYYENEETA